jgi:uncharacterized OB-fold protein
MSEAPKLKPMPASTPDTAKYWEMAAKHEFWLPRCVDTGCFFFPPTDTSPFTGGNVHWEKASGRGTLASFVISHVAAPGFEAPYVIALVDLEEGPRLTSNLLDAPARPEALQIGMALEVAFEQRGDMSIPQFKLAARGA